jgi:hypothetical protein
VALLTLNKTAQPTVGFAKRPARLWRIQGLAPGETSPPWGLAGIRGWPQVAPRNVAPRSPSHRPPGPNWLVSACETPHLPLVVLTGRIRKSYMYGQLEPSG